MYRPRYIRDYQELGERQIVTAHRRNQKLPIPSLPFPEL